MLSIAVARRMPWLAEQSRSSAGIGRAASRRGMTSAVSTRRWSACLVAASSCGQELLRCHRARMCLTSPRTPDLQHLDGVGVEHAVVPLVADRRGCGPVSLAVRIISLHWRDVPGHQLLAQDVLAGLAWQSMATGACRCKRQGDDDRLDVRLSWRAAWR